MKKTYFLIFLVNTIFSGEAPAENSSINITSSSPFKATENAIIKLLAVLPAILKKPNLSGIEIKPNGLGNGFKINVFYQARPEASFQTIAQQTSEHTSKPIAHPMARAASSVIGFEKKKSIQKTDLGNDVGAGLCQCSRCEYTRKN